MLRLALIISLALFASTACTKYVAAPPQAPAPTMAQLNAEAAKADAKPVGNQAVAFGMSWLPKVDPAMKCTPRSGRETAIESRIDTATCTSDGALSKSILICAAPPEGASACGLAADWNPQPKPQPPTEPTPTQAKADQAKGGAKK